MPVVTYYQCIYANKFSRKLSWYKNLHVMDFYNEKIIGLQNDSNKDMFERFLLFSLPIFERYKIFITWLRKYKSMLCVCNIKIVALTFFLFYTVISSQLCFKSQKTYHTVFLGVCPTRWCTKRPGCRPTR